MAKGESESQDREAPQEPGDSTPGVTGEPTTGTRLTTAPIAACGFRHSMAGAVEAFYLAFDGTVGWGRTVFGFILPAVIGNVVGGVLLVALLNHGQIVADRNARAAQS